MTLAFNKAFLAMYRVGTNPKLEKIMKEQNVFVACRNSNGSADFFITEVKCTQAEYDLGKHYDRAEELAKEEGYEPPFICFDESEHPNIALHFGQLNCPIPFTLVDKSNDELVGLSGQLLFGWDGISVQLEGYSDFHSEDNQGVVAYLEYWEGSPNIRTYSDINSEDPTSIDSFENARNELRKS